MIEKITLKNHEANISGNCVSSAKMLEDKRKLALGPHINSRALKPMSRTSGLRYVSLVAPVLRCSALPVALLLSKAYPHSVESYTSRWLRVLSFSISGSYNGYRGPASTLGRTGLLPTS